MAMTAPDAGQFHLGFRCVITPVTRTGCPIERGDEGLDLILRLYAPDLDKMKTWKAPRAVLVK